MRLKAFVSEFVFTDAMPPVCSASSRRLPCDIISSAIRSVCALNGPPVTPVMAAFVPGVRIAGLPANSGAPPPCISMNSLVMPTSPRGSIV